MEQIEHIDFIYNDACTFTQLYLRSLFNYIISFIPLSFIPLSFIPLSFIPFITRSPQNELDIS